MTRVIFDARHLFLVESMKPIWSKALSAFPSPAAEGQPRITLKRILADVQPGATGVGGASGGGGAGKADAEVEATRPFKEAFQRSTLGQMYEQLGVLGDGLFFRTGQIWKVTLAGFNSVDAGGP